MVRSIAALVLVCSALFTIAGPAPAAEPLVIDFIIPLTGQAGLGGQTTAKTLGAIEDIVNKSGGIHGRPVRFDIHDDTSNPQTAVQLVNQVLNHKPLIVFGSMLGATCQAMVPLFKNGPVHYCFSPVIYPPSGGFVFTASPATRTYATAYYRYFRARGIKNFAMIASTDASGSDADVQFERELSSPEFKDAGLTMVARERFNVTDISVAAQLTRIKAANPQALIAYANGAPFGTLLHGIHDAGLEIPIFATSSAMVLTLLKQLTDVTPQELYFPGFPVVAHVWRNPRAKAEQDRFIAADAAYDSAQQVHDFINGGALQARALGEVARFILAPLAQERRHA